MKIKDQIKLSELEAKLLIIRGVYENLLPIFSSIDRKKKMLELDIKMIEDRMAELKDNQLGFDAELGF
jgi:hypothetical protein